MKLKSVLGLLDLLNEHSWASLDDLVKRTGVNRRSLIRYIKEVRAAFEPLDVIDSGRNGYKLKANTLLDRLRGPYELDYRAAALSNPLGGLFRVPGSELPERVKKLADRIEMKGLADIDILRRTVLCMNTGQYLRLRYQSRGGPKEHLCVPVKLFLDYYLLYMVVYDRDYGHMVLMAVNKVQKADESMEKMSMTELEGYRAYVNKAWGKMIRHDTGQISRAVFDVNPEILPYFEKNPLHGSQIITKLETGTRIELDVHNPLEFVRYAMRFGRLLRVRGDEAVLAEMVGNVNAMADFYKDPASAPEAD